GDADIEEEDRRDQQRHREAPFLAVQAGRDERPQLVEHVGHRDQQGGEERQLEGRGEGRHHAGGDEVAARRQFLQQRLGHEAEQLIGGQQTWHEGDADGDERTQQPVAQLQQVRDQRTFGELLRFAAPRRSLDRWRAAPWYPRRWHPWGGRGKRCPEAAAVRSAPAPAAAAPRAAVLWRRRVAVSWERPCALPPVALPL